MIPILVDMSLLLKHVVASRKECVADMISFSILRFTRGKNLVDLWLIALKLYKTIDRCFQKCRCRCVLFSAAVLGARKNVGGERAKEKRLCIPHLQIVLFIWILTLNYYNAYVLYPVRCACASSFPHDSFVRTSFSVTQFVNVKSLIRGSSVISLSLFLSQSLPLFSFF